MLVVFGSATPVSNAANTPQITSTALVAGGNSVRPRAPTDLKKVVIGGSWMLGIL
jgi:hypothetical protein